VYILRNTFVMTVVAPEYKACEDDKTEDDRIHSPEVDDYDVDHSEGYDG
jgi:hypothetical protein